MLAPCELHTNYNIRWKTESAEAALHESALPDLYKIVNHKTAESFRLEKTFKTIDSNP